jgi:sigma-B regulation protein RsbU (phosphoserine phosphatase)
MAKLLRLSLRYAVAVLTVAVAILIALCFRAELQPAPRHPISGPLLLVAVAISAWYGGNGPGLLAAILSLLGPEYLFSTPAQALDIAWNDLPQIIAIVGAALLVGRLTGKRRHAEAALHRSDEKLRAACLIQQRLYPSRVPVLPGIEIAGASFPAHTVGGDYFDYIPLPGGAMGIVIGDVTGHGLGPALLMAETRAYLRALSATHDDIGEILTLTNRLLVEDTEEEFVTLFFAALDPRHGRFTYAGAGHEGFLLEPTGQRQRLRSTSLPLGMDRNLVVRCGPPIHLRAGQVFLLFTDGVCETHSQNGTLFGLERTLNVVHNTRTRCAHQIIDSLHTELHQFAHGRPQEDDITAVILKIQTTAR